MTQVDAGPDALEELRKHLLLCYTGTVRRNVGLIDRQIAMFEAGREDTLLGMKQLREMAYAMRDAIEAGRHGRLGAMLREAFEAKKRMNPHIAEDTPIEAMLDAAAQAGATGGKICGAGGGGYLLIAMPTRSASTRCARALEAMGGQFAPFEVDPDGVRARRGDATGRPAPMTPAGATPPRSCCSTATARSTRRSDHLDDPDELELIPGSADAIRRLRRARARHRGRHEPGATSVAGLARRRRSRIHARLIELLAAAGRRRRRRAALPASRPTMGCACRKPAPGMALEAAERFGFDPAPRVRGRRPRRRCGHGPGGRGHHVPRAHRSRRSRNATSRTRRLADHVVADLAAAAAIIATLVDQETE